MNISKSKKRTPKITLEVDYWKISYDMEDNLIVTYEGKTDMKLVHEVKYLGFIISEDGGNLKNIQALKNKSIGTIRKILNLI